MKRIPQTIITPHSHRLWRTIRWGLVATLTLLLAIHLIFIANNRPSSIHAVSYPYILSHDDPYSVILYKDNIGIPSFQIYCTKPGNDFDVDVRVEESPTGITVSHALVETAECTSANMVIGSGRLAYPIIVSRPAIILISATIVPKKNGMPPPLGTWGFAYSFMVGENGELYTDTLMS